MNRIYNFGAGPAVLPLPVLEEASRGILEIGGSGMSILEVSHRGKVYETIHRDAGQRLLSALSLSADDHVPLFMGGGASLQFAMLPMNFLTPEKTASYVNTGEWAKKAIQDAQQFGKVNVVASSQDSNFSYVPSSARPAPGSAYFHITTNNTIEGTEWPGVPETGGVPLVADMSSDILARAIDYSRFDLIYAGAQKNAGPAGVTLVIARKSFLAGAEENLPPMLSYKAQAKGNSLYNTPPVFAVYVVDLVLKWVEEQGGVGAMEEKNRRKAGVVYEALDRHTDTYEPTVTQKQDRSLMNVTFRLRDTAREEAFLAGAKTRGMEGLKGHRSVGGIRASLYNALPQEACTALATYLDEFAAGKAA